MIQKHYGYNKKQLNWIKTITFTAIISIIGTGCFSYYMGLSMGREERRTNGNSKYHLGVASWYDYGLENNVDYSKKNMTCASRDFPKGTRLRVTNLRNGKSVVCRVNDYVEHEARVIDLSSLAFKKISELKEGITPVIIKEVTNEKER